MIIYVPPLPGPQTGRYIAKIAAGGNQGNRTRYRQVLSEIYRVGIGRKEAREWKTVETERNEADRGTERNEADRFMVFLGKRCRRATQTELTVFLEHFLDAYRSLRKIACGFVLDDIKSEVSFMSMPMTVLIDMNL